MYLHVLFCLDKTPPKEWPNKGQIMFKNFNLRYSSDTPKVLKNINIVIQPAEKVFLCSIINVALRF